MTTPDAVPAADAAEQQRPVGGDVPPPAPAPLPADVPEADALEQVQPAGPDDAGRSPRSADDLPLEADPADAEEQAVAVPLDEDEGRS